MAAGIASPFAAVNNLGTTLNSKFGSIRASLR